MAEINYYHISGYLLGCEYNSAHYVCIFTHKQGFSGYIIQQVKYVANGEATRASKINTAQQANTINNDKRLQHLYRVVDKVLIVNERSDLRYKISLPIQIPF